MKRVLIQTVMLAAVLGGGYVGIVQVYKGFGPQPSPPPIDAAPAVAEVAPLKPIPLMAANENGGADPAEPYATANSQRDARSAYTPRADDGGYNRDRFVQPAAATDAQPYDAGPASSDGQRDRFAGNSAGRTPNEPRRLTSPDDRGAGRRGDPFGLSRPSDGAQQTAGYTPDESDAVVGGEAPRGNEEPRRLAAPGADRMAALDQPRNDTPVDRYGRPVAAARQAAASDSDLAQNSTASLTEEGASENLFAGGRRAGSDDASTAGNRADTSQAVDGVGRPGAQQLEGSQSPSLVIEKTAPPEIQVGKPAVFVIKVRNAGSVTAHGVEIRDDLPQGTQLVSTKPAATQTTPGKLVWSLGTMKPGDEATVQVQLMPTSEGEIGSMATVHFQAEASVRTRSTRPALKLQVTVPSKVMIGEDLTMRIRVSNPGSGAATGVVLTENVPGELKHQAGNELELEIGTLKPGESRELDLTLTAAQPGQVVNLLTARGDANLRAEDRAELEVLAPGLKIGLTGPKRRYLERNATFSVSVSNPGTATAKDIELTATLPRGLKFVEANNLGQYDAVRNTVHWSLEELPPQETGTVTVTTLPMEPGELKLQVAGKARKGLSDTVEESVVVEGLAAILFELVDVQDPIEVNGETTYEVRVVNQGSKTASNVRIVALLPPEMRPLGADGPVRFTIDGQRVLFEPLGQLAPKADTTFTIKAQALQAGDSRIRVQLMSDENRTPITKEESTRVYADE